MKKLLVIFLIASSLYGQKISDLPIASTPLSNTDLFYTVQTIGKKISYLTLRNQIVDTTRNFTWLGTHYFNGSTVYFGTSTDVGLPTHAGDEGTFWYNGYEIRFESTDGTKILASQGYVDSVAVDTSESPTWTGLHTWTQDSLRVNTLWYDFPASRVANSVLYDSLGNGILKWKVYPSADVTTSGTNIFTNNNYFKTGYFYFRDAEGDDGGIAGAFTTDRTFTLPDKDGTFAMTSDIPSLAGYVPTSRTITINGTSYDLSANRTWSVGDVTASGTNTFTGNNYFKTALTYLRDADGDDGQFLTALTLDRAWTFPDKDGTVAMTSDINTTNWDAAYNDKINSASFNTSNGIITLTQQDAGTVTVDIDGRFPALSDNNNWTGVNDFQADLKITDDFIKVPESATLDAYGGNYSIDARGKPFVEVTPTGNVTVINIADDSVVDGTIITIMNLSGSYTVTMNETDNLIVPGSSVVLGQRDNITFRYQTTGNFWVCIGYIDN